MQSDPAYQGRHDARNNLATRGVSRHPYGYWSLMIVLLVILVLLAMAFGVGAVLEGIAWALLIGIVLLAAAGWLAWQKLRGASRT